GTVLMAELKPDSAETCGLLARVDQGDRQALDQLLTRYRPGLRAFVEARLAQDLRARLDPSDVVQKAQLEVARRIEDFLRRHPRSLPATRPGAEYGSPGSPAVPPDSRLRSLDRGATRPGGSVARPPECSRRPGHAPRQTPAACAHRPRAGVCPWEQPGP